MNFESKPIITTDWGQFYLTNDAICEKLRKGEFWDAFIKPVYDQHLNKECVAIDVGAHIGSHTVYLSKLCKKVYAFEPQPVVYQQLLDNLKLNNCNNVETFNSAVYSEARNFKIDKEIDYSKNNCSASLGLILDESGPISSVTLDSLNLPELDLIKIDAQGCDLHVMMGAKETIKRHRPLIIFEIEDKTFLSRFNNVRDQYFVFCRENGYVAKELTRADYLIVPKEEDGLI